MRIRMDWKQKSKSRPILQAAAFLLLLTVNITYAGSLLGDVNSDQVINTMDALMVAQYYAKMQVPGINIAAADVDSNKAVDILDALIIGKYAAGLITFFPALPENWDAVQLYAREGDAFKTALVNNGFVVLDSLPYNTLTEAYGDFSGSYNLPVFITTDVLLHLFHITFAHMMETAEKEYLASRLKILVEYLDAYAANEYTALPAGTSLKTAAEQLRIFTAVAHALIDGGTAIAQAENDSLLQAANAILEKIYAHSAVEPYPGLDYTQFAPRSHYAGDAVLECYFRTVKWMQKYPFLVENSSTPAEAETGLLAAGILGRLINQYPVLSAYWNDIENFISGTLGAGESLTPLMVNDAMLTLFPGYPQEGYALLADQGSLGILQAELLTAQYPPEKSVRFLTESLLPDHKALVKTIYPHVVERYLPEGLDAAAALFGSQAAYEILLPAGAAGTTTGVQHKNQIDSLIAEYNSLPASAWGSSVSNRWFAVLRTLSEQPAAAAPRFMQTSLWQREKLNTQLASWAELHGGSVNLAPTPFPTPTPVPTPTTTTDPSLGDVNSNGKIDIIDALLIAQYATGLNPSGFNVSRADVNQDRQINILDSLIIAQYYVGLISVIPTATPTPPPGFVEPYPAFYSRYKEMCTKAIEVIDASPFLLSHRDRFTELYTYAGHFQDYSETLAAGGCLSQAGNEYIRKWGTELQSFLSNGSFIPGKTARSHVISDIFTREEQILHIAMGRLYPVIVMYYVPGHVYPFAGIGFVMSYYEFTANGVRMTNDQWEQMLISAPPAGAAWCSGFTL